MSMIHPATGEEIYLHDLNIMESILMLDLHSATNVCKAQVQPVYAP